MKQDKNAEAAKSTSERTTEAIEAAYKDLHVILYDAKQQLTESRTDALRAELKKELLEQCFHDIIFSI